MGTFSKSIAPAIRVSYMVLPMKLVEEYEKKCAFYSTTVSRIEQKILDEFIKEGYFERHLNKMRKCYKDKHDYLLELLEPFKKHFSITGENAGLHLLLTAKEEVSEDTLIKKAMQHGVKVYGLSESYVNGGKEGQKGTVLLGYGGLTKQEIEEGVIALKEAWL